MTVEQWLIEKGKMQGKMQGKMEGKMEGKIEGIRQEKELVATRLLEKGSSLQFVAEITGLSLDEVQRLLPETTEKQ